MTGIELWKPCFGLVCLVGFLTTIVVTCIPCLYQFFFEKVQFANYTLKVGTYLTKILWFHWFTIEIERDFSFLLKQLHKAAGIVKCFPPLKGIHRFIVFVRQRLDGNSPHVPALSGGPAANVNRYYFVLQMKSKSTIKHNYKTHS